MSLLEADVEFRYAVAGKLGLLELLRRLDSIEAELRSLREDFNKHEVEGARRFLAVEEQLAKLREDFNRHEIKEAKRFQAVEEHLKRHDEELKKLREDFNSMLTEIRSMNVRLSRVERTLEKLTLDIEEEARLVVKQRVREVYGVDIEVEPLILPEVEVNIYGASSEICVVGEASVRAGLKLVEELERKVERLRETRPDMLRPRVVKVIYTSLSLPGLADAAKERNIWVFKATGDIVPPPRSS